MKIPKTLGAQIDKLYAMRAERLAAEKAVDAMRADEAELREAILKHLASERMAKGSGKLATASAVTKVVGKVAADAWPTVYAYIAKHGAWELLQRRLNNAAWLERQETAPVPGVTAETVVELSLTKAGS